MLFLPFLISVALAAPQYYGRYCYPPKQQPQTQTLNPLYMIPPMNKEPWDNHFKGIGHYIDLQASLISTTPSSLLVQNDQGLDFNSLLQGLFSSQNSQNGRQ
ncbi:unnamed protein product [Caenorhabditis angaria]|uniref:Uncharacterized protein n=1 Tax=Caenorhabditis angaria TaxID=860376 RepID=A0A9P1IJE5_9PELO|nr:unnamed protein product [Caenorhabditis angaria]